MATLYYSCIYAQNYAVHNVTVTWGSDLKKKKIIVEIVLPIDMGVYVNHHSCMGASANCNTSIKIIEIGLEQALLVGIVSFSSSFEHAKKLLIMGPQNTKNSLKMWLSHI